MPDSGQVRVADELAAAQKEAARPAQRVSELEAALKAAVVEARFADAQSIQQELAEAREAAVLAEARVSALRAGVARIEHDRSIESRELADARQRHQAEQDLAAARQAEQNGLDQLGGSIAAMYESIAEAQRHFRAAQAAETGVTQARHAQVTARGQLGEWPADHPGPAVARANQATVLQERDALIHALARWSR
jgi:hypothetical protein